MPRKETIEKARKDKREGKSASTQAGEFIHDEIDKIRKGEHGARSTKQAIAIGLSQARRAGVKLPPPKKGKYGEDVRKKAQQDLETGEHPHKPNPRRSRARTKALKKEPKSVASHVALSRQAKSAARKRTKSERSASAKKAARSRTPAQRSASAKKAARTRARKK